VCVCVCVYVCVCVCVQIYVQAARLAELLQLKLLMLLTVQERLDEAVAQASTHLTLFSVSPGECVYDLCTEPLLMIKG